MVLISVHSTTAIVFLIGVNNVQAPLINLLENEPRLLLWMEQYPTELRCLCGCTEEDFHENEARPYGEQLGQCPFIDKVTVEVPEYFGQPEHLKVQFVLPSPPTPAPGILWVWRGLPRTTCHREEGQDEKPRNIFDVDWIQGTEFGNRGAIQILRTLELEAKGVKMGCGKHEMSGTKRSNARVQDGQ